MNAALQDRCQLLITNRSILKNAFPWEASAMHLCIAAMYTMNGLTADGGRIKACRELIRHSVGPFNNFRSTGELTMAAMIDLSGDPQTILDRALKVYDLLKAHFAASTYLPMSAVVIARHVPVSHFDEICANVRAIYDRMRKEHPFLTSSEDCASCTLMALSGMDHDLLIHDMETSYALLKDRFFDNDAVQSLSHALALYPGDPTIKAQRTMDFFLGMKQLGYKWDTSFSLSMLAVVAMTSSDQQAVMQQVIDVADWLKQQKGFGFWSSVSAQMRLMYAGMLVNAVMAADSNTNMTSMVTNSVVAAIIAQQAAVTTAVVISTSHH